MEDLAGEDIEPPLHEGPGASSLGRLEKGANRWHCGHFLTYSLVLLNILGEYYPRLMALWARDYPPTRFHNRHRESPTLYYSPPQAPGTSSTGQREFWSSISYI